MLEVILQSWTATAFAAVFATALAVTVRSHLRNRGRKYPPGPPGDPIIGHVRTIASYADHPHLYYTELNKKYGDVVYIDAMGKPIILLGTHDVASQLLMKRGTIYSNRPIAPFNDKILDLEELPPVALYGPVWKEERRMYHSHLSRETIRELYRGDIETMAQEYVLRWMAESKTSSEHYDEALHKTFIQTMYGIKITKDDDPMLRTALKGTEIASAALVPGRYLVNVFPSLLHVPEWFPGTGWKQEGKIGRKFVQDMIQIPYAKVKQAEAEGTAKQSFTSNMIRDTTTLSESNVIKTAGSTFIAGVETTAAMVQYFIFAMLKNPGIQKKAQEEVDRVVGHDRLPTVEDFSQMPYIDAIIKELLRWQPATPVSVPHETMQDDVFNGYFIPKGAIIVQNSWAIAMDEKVYPNPEKFIPERFMVDSPPMDPRQYMFGVGRRICPGMQYAENVYVAAILTILATVNVAPALDQNGNEIPAILKTTGKIANVPYPFEFSFKPRSEASTALLHAAVGA